jgi:VanZ like family
MTTTKSRDLSPRLTSYPCSTRLLILSVAGILFLTLYPFRFDFTRTTHNGLLPVCLDGWGKDAGTFDGLLNVLLFIPFGFGLAAMLRRRGKSLLSCIGLCFLCGALLSYMVEVTQLFVPSRDSGWDDVFTNSSGSLVGCLMFAAIGKTILRAASSAEFAFRRWLTPVRGIAILALYSALWIVVSVSLQKKSRPVNWVSGSFLVLANEVTAERSPGWKGRILEVDLWDINLPANIPAELSSHGQETVVPAPLATYQLSGRRLNGSLAGVLTRDSRGTLPSLAPAPRSLRDVSQQAFVFDGNSWLVSQTPVEQWIDAVRATRQFAIRIVCAPNDVVDAEGTILSLFRPPSSLSLEVHQEGTNLLFWFRTPFSPGRYVLPAWIPNVFAARQNRDVILSYDGANLYAYVDGVRQYIAFRLDPGVGLARHIRSVKSRELQGYHYIFYILVFVPAGALLGFTWLAVPPSQAGRKLLVFLIFLLPCVILELALMHTSGRRFSAGAIALSVFFLIAGSLWINADAWLPSPDQT